MTFLRKKLQQIIYSHQSHVHHIAPSLVVSIRGVWVLVVIWCLDCEFGIIWVRHVEFNVTLEGSEMLTMSLEGKMPEDSLPNERGLGILKPHNILIVRSLRYAYLMETWYIEPKRHHTNTCKHTPALEPSLWIDIEKCPIWISLKGSSNWESVRSVLLGKNTESIGDIGTLSR